MPSPPVSDPPGQVGNDLPLPDCRRLDLDGGWSGVEQHLLVNNFTVNGDVFSAAPAAILLPAALPLLASGIGGLGLLGWRRKRKAAALAA